MDALTVEFNTMIDQIKTSISKKDKETAQKYLALADELYYKIPIRYITAAASELRSLESQIEGLTDAT